MANAFPSLKRLPLPAAALIFAAAAAIGLAAVWPLLSSPSPETVFWQTMESNLNSGSIVLDTQITTEVLGGKALAEHRAEISFAYETEAYFTQRSLLFDEDATEIYADRRQIESYLAIGLEIPAQEWYEQEVYASEDTTYARHDLSTEPPVADWSKRHDPYFVEAPLGGWQARPGNGEDLLGFQQFLMSSLAHNSIFFFGNLNADSRDAVLAGLEGAYRIDFDKTDSYHRGGRLLYEYEVAVDYQRLEAAFFQYWQALVDEETKKQLEPIINRIYFTGQPNLSATYQVVIDARARQIVEFNHPYELARRLLYDFAPPDLSVQPYFAPTAELLVFHGFDVNVTTKVLAQNQRLSLAPPCAGETGSVSQRGCLEE